MQMKKECRYKKLDIKSGHIWQKSQLMDEQVRPTTTQNENKYQQQKNKQQQKQLKITFVFYDGIFSLANSYV